MQAVVHRSARAPVRHADKAFAGSTAFCRAVASGSAGVAGLHAGVAGNIAHLGCLGAVGVSDALHTGAVVAQGQAEMGTLAGIVAGHAGMSGTVTTGQL